MFTSENGPCLNGIADTGLQQLKVGKLFCEISVIDNMMKNKDMTK